MSTAIAPRPWKRLEQTRSRLLRPVPKLGNLRLALGLGITIPPTLWAWADELTGAALHSAPRLGGPFVYPLILRSASPSEDSSRTSNAGQFVSRIVSRPDDYPKALMAVISSLPTVSGRTQGAVFLQPFLSGAPAGVTFFDGFYYEETCSNDGNTSLTSGADRGMVTRGHIERGHAPSLWMARVHRVLGVPVDIEWAEAAPGHASALGLPPTQRILLQVRPALFPLRRNETLSLANHKEILGDPPSPWMVGLLAEAARPVMRYFESIDPRVARWNETYAVELAGRAWLNFSAFFRLMDLWGLPRSLVTEGVGGTLTNPEDQRIRPLPFLRSIPLLIRLQLFNLIQILQIGRGFRALDRAISQASTLPELWKLNVDALDFAIRTNFAINGALSGLVRFRKRLGLDRAARLITEEMMTEYARLASLEDPATRAAALEPWLKRFGHRGPFESDPSQPRFSELRDILRADLEKTGPSQPTAPKSQGLLSAIVRPLFWLDEIRESFRDQLMLRWQQLRLKILSQARQLAKNGFLDRPDDIFLLRGTELSSDPSTWPSAIRESRKRWELARAMVLPDTGSRDEIEQASTTSLESISDLPSSPAEPLSLRGIGLPGPVTRGTVVHARHLAEILSRPQLPEVPILVVGTLEPSWALVFPRVRGVISELGGELSHAAILLREAGIPAVLNVGPSARLLPDDQTVLLDPNRGTVTVLEPIEAPPAAQSPPLPRCVS